MGLSCSPDFVNLYALSYEWRAVERIKRLDRGQLREARLKAFQHLYRLMDDVRVVNGEALHELIYTPQQHGDPCSSNWVYPPCVKIKDTTGTDGVSVYLDIKTRQGADGRYTTQTYRKEAKLPFNPVKYTFAASNRPSKAGYNTIIGLVRSAVYHSSGPGKAAQDIYRVIKVLARNGYDRSRLIWLAKRAMAQGNFLESGTILRGCSGSSASFLSLGVTTSGLHLHGAYAPAAGTPAC